MGFAEALLVRIAIAEFWNSDLPPKRAVLKYAVTAVEQLIYIRVSMRFLL
jgi:hypothetical protein